MASEMSIRHYHKPLVLEYSGGKDSDVLLKLFEISNIPFEIHHSHTSADPPPVVRHIRDVYARLEVRGVICNYDYHIRDGKAVTMWNLIPRKLLPPTRRMRYCCSELKETGNRDRMIATGVRWAESRKRRALRYSYEIPGSTKERKTALSDEIMLVSDNALRRRWFERCEMKAKTIVNPIIDWSHEELWDFIREEKIDLCEMYQWGYERLGCIGCPMAGRGQRIRELSDFPEYKHAYIRSFERMLDMRKEKGLRTTWKYGEEVYEWWING